MNKEELLNELYKLNRFEVSVEVLDFLSKTAVKLNHVLALVDQLDEPEKVTIPQEAADWIESVRSLSNSMSYLMTYDQIKRFSHELTLWCYESGNNDNLHKLARAWLDGYEVEKEPLYYVKLPTAVWNDEASELEDSSFYLRLNITSDEIAFSNLSRKLGDWSGALTEKQIKNIDPRYWPFAEPVEESQ